MSRIANSPYAPQICFTNTSHPYLSNRNRGIQFNEQYNFSMYFTAKLKKKQNKTKTGME